MVYHGRVKDGVIVLDGDVRLPEGTRVNVAPKTVDAGVDRAVNNLGEPVRSNGESLAAKLLKHAGACDGLPADLARNHSRHHA